MSKGGYKKQRARFVQDEFELEDTEFKQKSHESPHQGRGGSMSEELAMDELDFGEENINKPGKKSKRMSRYQKESLMDEGGGVVSAAAAGLTRKMTEMVGAGIREEQFRNIFINAPQYNRQKKFKSNVVSTTKYNVFTFLFKFLYEQFSKYANLFFLFTSCIQQIPGVTPTSRYTTVVPLLLVLLAAAIKEVIEDVKRYRSDQVVNNSIVKVLRGGEFVKIAWKKLEVGDIVRLENRSPIPADIVLLSSSEPDGLCYVETSNLDGETNLKLKQARSETAKILSVEQLEQLVGRVESELPNDSLYTYEATLISEDGVLGRGTRIGLDPSQLLLRGAVIRNTNWVFGVVVNTGHDSKLMKNATAAPIKQTSVERMTNVQILFLFGILLILSVSSAFGNYITTNRYRDDYTYLYLPRITVWQFIKNIMTFLLLYNNLIPISLVVTMEVVKFWQAQLINSDLDMYNEKTDSTATARTSSLVEELGQVGYIFSDKTGTLTCNIMEFKQCSIGGYMYSESLDATKREKMVDGEAGEYRTFTELLEQLRQEGPNGEIFEFLQLVATCHTVIPEIKEVDGEMVMEYQASSPDEEALVKGVAEFGFKFNVRKPKTIVVNVLGQDLEYQVLNVNEFNSTRKRMSAILRMPDGTIKLYCKGADTVIFERLAEHSRENVGKTVSHLEEFASEGLRTLCLSSRVISEQEYQNWSQIYSTAATTLKNRQEALDNAAELIEKDMVLVGATAIEDKLQEGVPRTIAMLAQAGIKIWVLTGDRQETAINIGYSCKLLQEDYSLVICNTNTHWETKQFLNQKLVAIRESRGTSTIDFDSMALVIDGRSLDFALEKDVENVFLDLATVCKAVICCRVSPLQKALVVRLVKRKRRAVLLAIGDGANDVSMIQAAHVGVGISGQEGLQAARAADFAISEFQHLRKLLLVHGAWSYNRLSKMILYSFYKNILLYMTQFFFAFYNMFTGQTLYESWSITFYSVFFSLMPPFAIGIFDQFLSARSLERYPEMYKMSQLGEFFNVRAFWGSTINAFVHSATIFFLSLAFLNPIITSAGYSADLWTLGVTLYTCAIITVLLKASLLVYTWNKWTLVSIPGSLVLWFLFFPLYSYLGYYLNLGYVYYGLFPITMGTLGFWLSAIISPLLCMVRDFAWKYYKRMYGTRAYQIVQEIQKFNIPDYRPRMERFRKAVHKARTLQRLKRNRGYAFSQTETGQAKIIRSYDTTKRKPTGV